METVLMYLLFAIGIVLIVKGGDWFVDGAVWVAEVTKIPKFIIGATVISLATTLPEIIVSTIAAVEGHQILTGGVGNYLAASQDKVGMAIGNGIGSVICNTAMILAISIIFMPLAGRFNALHLCSLPYYCYHRAKQLPFSVWHNPGVNRRGPLLPA